MIQSIFRNLPALALLIAVPALAGVEYFVAKTGDDANAGTSPSAAFASIQRGLDALGPGDTLTIGPGEYFGASSRDRLGGPAVDTTIRAALPGTVVLRGDEPAPAFDQTDGFLWVHGADIAGPVFGVSELDTLTPLRRVASKAQLEFSPGAFYHDAEEGRLYISTTDMRAPSAHTYRVSRVAGHGLYLGNPQRVRIQGLIATGFSTDQSTGHYPGYGFAWGILLGDPDHCTIANCTAFLNGAGIGMHRQGDVGNNRIDGCWGYANRGGGVCGYSADNDEIRNSVAFRSGYAGIVFYGAGNRGPAMLRNNLAWGNAIADIRIKGGANEFHFAENCVALGNLDVRNVSHSLIGVDNIYNRDLGSDNIWYAREAREQRYAEFVDPDNLDFRLQSTSVFRGAGPDGADRGPFPFAANVFFVAPEGDDAADGMSLGSAWRTLGQALGRLRPGDTLYLLGGSYAVDAAVSVSGTEEAPLSIRGYGHDTVIVKGELRVENSGWVDFQRLNFAAPVRLAGGREIAFENCRFFGGDTGIEANSVDGLRVTHCMFSGFTAAAVAANRSTGLFLQSNIFDNDAVPAVRLDDPAAIQYSDYNSFRNRHRACALGAAGNSAELAAGHDVYSIERQPELRIADGLPTLANAAGFAGLSPRGGGLGPTSHYAPSAIVASEPRVHSVSDTTADIEWWTSTPAHCRIEWGPAQGGAAREAVVTSDGYASMSLTDLDPGQEYRVRLVAVEPEGTAVDLLVQGIRPGTTATFQTLGAPVQPRTIHVSTDGSDSNSGLSAGAPLRTVARAADLARAGDTVLIGGGVYSESVRVRSTGAAGQPVTFRAAPGEKVVLDGAARLITTAFHIRGKHHIHLDGLYFEGVGMAGWSGAVDVIESDHVTISRCFYNGRGPGYAPRFLNAEHANYLTVENCVLANGFEGLVARGCANLVVRNCVFLRNLIQGMIVNNNPAQPVTLENNVFVDSHTGKERAFYLELARVESLTENNNLFYMRLPDAERQIFAFYGNEEYERAMQGYGIPIVYPAQPLIAELTRMSLADYQGRFAPHSTSQFGDPVFAGVLEMETGERGGYLGDKLAGMALDFPDLFVTNPDFSSLATGLDPAAFSDFHFQSTRSEAAE